DHLEAGLAGWSKEAKTLKCEFRVTEQNLVLKLIRGLFREIAVWGGNHDQIWIECLHGSAGTILKGIISCASQTMASQRCA
ncbi:hypothetical protein ACFL2T_07260, partial [Elusimicrobiota bacterium]